MMNVEARAEPRPEQKSSSAGFESALDGTVHWTLSLYASAEAVTAKLGGQCFTIGELEKRQRRHKASFALKLATDPLFNDIADREVHGGVGELLFAAGVGRDTSAGKGASGDYREAARGIRTPMPLTFDFPTEFKWSTEGKEFVCRLPMEAAGDGRPSSSQREVMLRRFWMAHGNGAMSYHLSFSLHYQRDDQDDGGYGPATYYFLSLIQKMMAPKEFSLSDERLQDALTRAPGYFCPLTMDKPCGIDPLDRVTIERKGGRAQRFWPFVRDMFEADARILFSEVLDVPGGAAHQTYVDLVPTVDFIEVPGLRLPRSRFMFMFQDARFFDRLLPLDADGKRPIPRKEMVRDECYEPFVRRMSELLSDAEQNGDRVHLGLQDGDSGERCLDWRWVTKRPEFDRAIEAGWFRDGTEPITTMTALVHAMRRGTCKQVEGTDYFGNPVHLPRDLHVPAFSHHRADCLDYLFLAGFNQNIIDFMNQDTSEILDSLDPIYPTEDLQSHERFFVRYANHRAMISYVARSRSLEAGNDYIGTCPYAFLIHALAMHNEFLVRDHERKHQQEIERIKDQADKGKGADHFVRVEKDLNALKQSAYWDFERFRYSNVFRYDTEAAVFEKLERLRGISRQTAALADAVRSLEDYAGDLESRTNQQNARDTERREDALNSIVATVGLLSALGVLTSVSQFCAEPKMPAKLGFDWASIAFGFSTLVCVVSVVALGLVVFIVSPALKGSWRQIKQMRGELKRFAQGRPPE